MALRQYRPDLNEDYLPKEKQAQYQEYRSRNPYKEQLKEVLFFVNIALFSIFTVIATYIYLSLRIPAFFAFLFAILTGFVTLRFVRAISKAYFRKLKKKK